MEIWGFLVRLRYVVDLVNLFLIIVPRAIQVGIMVFWIKLYSEAYFCRLKVL